MKIVIAGAGEVGFHLAKLLTLESQDIILLDQDSEVLQYAENHLDIITEKGDATSFNTLRALNIDKVDVFIAVTDSQNTNLTSALLAKKLGAKKTIARVSNPEYLQRVNRLSVQRMGIDSLISPEELAAQEINYLIEESAFSEMHCFEEGRMNIYGVNLDDESVRMIGKSIKEVSKSVGEDIAFIPMVIIRHGEEGSKYETIIPRGNTIYEKGDRVYFFALKEGTNQLYNLLGKKHEDLGNITVVGGGSIGRKISKMLTVSNHSVKLIENNKKRAYDLAEELKNVLVIYGDGTQTELLDEEGIEDMDAFIAVTGRSEFNIMSCLLAKSKGVKKTIALVESKEYMQLAKEVGVSASINKKLLAANSIFRYVRKGKVLAIASLSDVEAEVLEFKVDSHSEIRNKCIKDINFPKEAIITGVLRGDREIIPTIDFKVLEGDRVVVFALNEVIQKVEDFFHE